MLKIRKASLFLPSQAPPLGFAVWDFGFDQSSENMNVGLYGMAQGSMARSLNIG